MRACGERTLLGGYVLGALDPGEQEAVRRHLDACPSCRAERERLRPLPALIELARGEEELPAPPAALEESVLDGYAGDHRPLSRRPLPRRRALGALLAAALATVAGLGLAGVFSSGEPPESYRLVGTSRAPLGEGEASFARHTAGTSVWLRVRSLPVRPDTHYELWFMRGGERLSAGTFRTDRRGGADVRLWTAADPRHFSLMRVVVERRGASRGWRSPSVLDGRLQ